MQRFVILVLGFVVLFLGGSHPLTALGLFLGLYMLNQILGGITTPGWFDLFAKLTPVDRRGRLAGFRNSVGGSAAFICGLILTWMLSSFLFPVGYALAFFCAFVLQMISIVTQVNLIEEEPSAVLPRRPVFAFLRRLPDVFHQNAGFRNFIIVSMCLIVATMPVGFFTVYALDQFQAQESVVGQFTLTIVATQIVSAAVNGFVADRYGNKRALLVTAVGMLCASVCALMAPSLAWFRLVFVFLGVNLGSELMTRYSLCIEYGSAQQRSTLIGLMNTLLSPFYLVGLVGGWLSNTYGYHAVFLGGVVFSLIGIVLLVTHVQDPRARAMKKTGPPLPARTNDTMAPVVE
jgi:MFS family permease